MKDGVAVRGKRAEPGDRRIGSNHLNNFQKSILIKKEMLRIHNEIKAEGTYPTLRKILRVMPFYVNENWGGELRRELIEEGLIPKPPRGCTKNAQESAEDRIVSMPSPKEIEECKLEINKEHFALMKDNEDDEDLVPMSPKQASEWARKSYDVAWQSVQAISRQGRCWAFLAHPETVEVK